jgi:hypothetical protein
VKNFLQRHFINFLTKHLFNAIDKDEVIRITIETNKQTRLPEKKAYIGDRELDVSMMNGLKAEAEAYLNSSLYKIVIKYLKYAHNQRMFVKGKDGDDLLAGKLGLFNLEKEEEIIKEIAKL